jgi:hypothetical protein
MNLNQLEGYFTKKVHDRAKVVVDNTLNLMVDELMYRSPVGQPEEWRVYTPSEDYTPGKYKSNWLHSIGSPVYVELEDTRDNSFQQKDCETGRRLKQQIASNKLLFTNHYFTNDTPYAKSVEYGLVPWQSFHNPQSQTFPHAVAGLVAQETPSLLTKAKRMSK